MKIDILEAHDRYQHLSKQDMDIGACCQDVINKRPFGDYPFYLFVHARTDDDGIRKRLIWQPRLTRPKAQTNSMLFKVDPNTEEVRICWMIPPREMFGQYDKGKVTEHDITAWSIDMFENHRAELEKPEPDDFDDEKVDAIYREISLEARRRKATKI